MRAQGIYDITCMDHFHSRVKKSEEPSFLITEDFFHEQCWAKNEMKFRRFFLQNPPPEKCQKIAKNKPKAQVFSHNLATCTIFWQLFEAKNIVNLATFNKNKPHFRKLATKLQKSAKSATFNLKN